MKLIRITNSRVHLVDGSDKHDFNDVNFELRDFSKTSALPFTLSADAGGAGKLKVEGKAGPIVEANTAATPLRCTDSN